MNRGRTVALSAVVLSWLAAGMVATAPSALAASAPLGPVAVASADRVQSAFLMGEAEWKHGFDVGYQAGLKQGTEDARHDCKRSPQPAVANESGDYIEGWKAGYPPGYDKGYGSCNPNAK